MTLFLLCVRGKNFNRFNNWQCNKTMIWLYLNSQEILFYSTFQSINNLKILIFNFFLTYLFVRFAFWIIFLSLTISRYSRYLPWAFMLYVHGRLPFFVAIRIKGERDTTRKQFFSFLFFLLYYVYINFINIEFLC